MSELTGPDTVQLVQCRRRRCHPRRRVASGRLTRLPSPTAQEQFHVPGKFRYSAGYCHFQCSSSRAYFCTRSALVFHPPPPPPLPDGLLKHHRRLVPPPLSRFSFIICLFICPILSPECLPLPPLISHQSTLPSPGFLHDSLNTTTTLLRLLFYPTTPPPHPPNGNETCRPSVPLPLPTPPPRVESPITRQS